MSSLLILGAGGFGRVAAEIALAGGQYRTIRFLDDTVTAPYVLGPCADYARFLADYPDAAVAIGNNPVRLAWLERLEQAGFRLPVILSGAAYVSPSAHIGQGSFVLPGAVVNTGAEVGRGCIVNCGAVLDHNCVLEEGVHACLSCVVKAGARVPALSKIEAGQVIRSPWETK